MNMFCGKCKNIIHYRLRPCVQCCDVMFGIYIFSKGKAWRTAGDELLHGYTNAFHLGKKDKNEHIQQFTAIDILRKMQNKHKVPRNNK